MITNTNTSTMTVRFKATTLTRETLSRWIVDALLNTPDAANLTGRQIGALRDRLTDDLYAHIEHTGPLMAGKESNNE